MPVNSCDARSNKTVCSAYCFPSVMKQPRMSSAGIYDSAFFYSLEQAGNYRGRSRNTVAFKGFRPIDKSVPYAERVRLKAHFHYATDAHTGEWTRHISERNATPVCENTPARSKPLLFLSPVFFFSFFLII